MRKSIGRHLARTCVALAVTGLAWAGQAPSGGASRGATAREQAPVGRGRMGSMMTDRQQMLAEMEKQQRRLDDLVTAMNAAAGADKVTAIAAALNELVAQHKAMHARMAAMDGGMMRGRMGGGGNPAASPQAPAAEHDQHHP